MQRGVFLFVCVCVYLEEIWDAAIIDQTKGISSWSEQSAGRFLEAVIQSVAPSSLQHPGPEFHASFFCVRYTKGLECEVH